MRLHVVLEPPNFVARCQTCGQTIPAGTTKVADLDGEPFRAYYHVRCTPPTEEERPDHAADKD